MPGSFVIPILGWALARAHWGKGYALEASRAALRHAFEMLGWTRAVSLIDARNVRSIRLAERLGERLEGETVVRGFRVRVYGVARGLGGGG